VSVTVATPPHAGGARRVLVVAAAANLAFQILIVVTGGIVRLTASGLGCPDWPECVPGSITPTADQVEGTARWIEFGNRLLTFLVGLGALAVVVAVLVLKRRVGLRGVAVLAAMPLVGTAGQAVLGGITVRTGLHPATVAGHFLLSMALIAVSTWLLTRVAEPPGPVTERLPRPLRLAAWALALAGSAVLVLGTVVTGSGPHSGDADEPARFGFDPRTVSWLHADAVMLLVGLLAGYLVGPGLAGRGRPGGSRRAPGGRGLHAVPAGAAPPPRRDPHVPRCRLHRSPRPERPLDAPARAGRAVGSGRSRSARAGRGRLVTAAPVVRPGAGAGAADSGVALTARPSWSATLRAYVALTKPRIIELLLVTALPTLLLADRGLPPLVVVAGTLVGGTLAAGSANAFNQYFDRDIDAVMTRTRHRPLPQGSISPRGALVFATVLGVAATVVLWVATTPLAAALGIAAILMYVVGYTLILKRRTPQNIVWGGAAGCMPVLIAWAAVTGTLSWAALLLFLVVFFWTPPHYWPLSMRFRDDYAAAGVPMLPVVASARSVAVQVLGHSTAMLAATLVLIPVAGLGWIYAVTAVVAGTVFAVTAVGFARRILQGRHPHAMRLFHVSITYLTLLFAAVGVDALL
jgi:protoheme IX farnesyltransferase